MIRKMYSLYSNPKNGKQTGLLNLVEITNRNHLTFVLSKKIVELIIRIGPDDTKMNKSRAFLVAKNTLILK
jgi:hypothetical protein